MSIIFYKMNNLLMFQLFLKYQKYPSLFTLCFVMWARITIERGAVFPLLVCAAQVLRQQLVLPCAKKKTSRKRRWHKSPFP